MTSVELSKLELLREQKRQMIDAHKKVNKIEKELDMKSKFDRIEKSKKEVLKES